MSNNLRQSYLTNQIRLSQVAAQMDVDLLDCLFEIDSDPERLELAGQPGLDADTTKTSGETSFDRGKDFGL